MAVLAQIMQIEYYIYISLKSILYSGYKKEVHILKIEMHAHTSEVSPCAKVPADGMVKACAEAGYQGVVVTDHFNDYVLESFPGSARDRVTRYLEGFQRAQEAGAKLGIQVILGMESCIAGGPEDFLVYGIDKDFLYQNPRFYQYTQEQAYQTCREYGALFFQAHPCRSYCKPRDPHLLDGVEIYNGNPRHENNNRRAKKWAEKYHLMVSSGSDFHQLEDAGLGGIILSTNVQNSRELAAVLKQGTAELIQTP